MDLNQVLISILSSVWEFIKDWWWLPAPFVLGRLFLFLWKWWRMDIFNAQNKRIVIEVRIPKEILKPIRAMETVLSNLWQIVYDPPYSWEKWIEGKFIMSYSFEIASINGEPHFFIRFPEANRDAVEAAIYAQYPDAEISVVDDYTKFIPQDIPNKDWDLWGADYRLLKPDPYPIKTYTKFETEHEALEEKRIDPLAQLLEAMAKTGPGEQIWVQFVAKPITNDEVPWVTEGEEVRDKLARRETRKTFTGRPLLVEAADVLITGNVPGAPKTEEKEIIPPEMKLTPGEREVIGALEQKIAKLGFQSSVRFIYLGNKESFFKAKLRLPLSYFGAFTTQDLNAIVPWGQPYITKVQKSWFLPKNLYFDRKLYFRKRRIFRQYKLRIDPKFPASGGTFVLNTEELATMFHFPGKQAAPAPFVQRIEAKKGEAPPGLPTE
ncbi:hypothetical protein AMJ47_00195 [Parcubacteria bacterium DG_72]|nr:MAG: hypothetical protein AMJ47_00195 [Parcubacteria bacterium DG_72]